MLLHQLVKQRGLGPVPGEAWRIEKSGRTDDGGQAMNELHMLAALTAMTAGSAHADRCLSAYDISKTVVPGAGIDQKMASHLNQ